MKNIFAQMYKAEEQSDGTCIVYSRAAAEELDKSREILDYASAVPQFEKFRDDASARSGGKSQGNIRAMHGKIAAGKATEMVFVPAEKAVDVVAHIIDKQEATKCLEGVYTGMSIGGDYLKRWPDPVVPNAFRYTPILAEISLVDSPCIPSATFRAVKCDGSEEMRKFAESSTADPLGKKIEQPRDSSSKFSLARDENGAVKWGAVHRGLAVKARADGNDHEALQHEAEGAGADATSADASLDADNRASLHEKAATAHKAVAESAEAKGDDIGVVLHQAKAAGHEAEASRIRAEKVDTGGPAPGPTDGGASGMPGISTDAGLNFVDHEQGDPKKCAKCGSELVDGKCGKCADKAADGDMQKVIVLPAIYSDQLKRIGAGEDPKVVLTAEQHDGLAQLSLLAQHRIADAAKADAATLVKEAEGINLPSEKTVSAEDLMKNPIPDGLGKLKGEEALKAARAHIEQSFPRALKAHAGEDSPLAKSMYDVGNLASMLTELAWMQERLVQERTYENDDSKVPDKIREVLTSLKQVFIDLATEEVNELIREEEAEKAAAAPMGKAAGSTTETGGGQMATTLNKLAARLRKSSDDELNAFVDRLVKAAGHMTKMRDGLDKAMGHAETMGDHLDDMKDHVDKLCGKAAEGDALAKAEGEGLKSLYSGMVTAQEGITAAHEAIHGALEEYEDEAEADVDSHISTAEKIAKAVTKATHKQNRVMEKMAKNQDRMMKVYQAQNEALVKGIIDGFTAAGTPQNSAPVDIPARTQAPGIVVNKAGDGSGAPGQVVKADGAAAGTPPVAAPAGVLSPVLKDGVTPNPDYLDQMNKAGGTANSFEKVAADMQPQTGDPFKVLRDAGMEIGQAR